MTTHIPDSLADKLGRAICRCTSNECRLTLNNPALCRTIIGLLSAGRPVSLDELAIASEQPFSDVAEIIHQSQDIEIDEGGNIVGAGLTIRPTPHQVEMNGRLLYTWCALDTLLYPPLLGHVAHVESPCLQTGVPVRFTVTPQGVENLQPPEAVVSILIPQSDCGIRQSFCNHVHFFRSPETAESWLSQHPGAVILSVAEAYVLGQRLLIQRS